MVLCWRWVKGGHKNLVIVVPIGYVLTLSPLIKQQPPLLNSFLSLSSTQSELTLCRRESEGEVRVACGTLDFEEKCTGSGDVWSYAPTAATAATAGTLYSTKGRNVRNDYAKKSWSGKGRKLQHDVTPLAHLSPISRTTWCGMGGSGLKSGI